MLFHPSFTATFQSGELRRQFDLRGEIPPFKPRYNIQPSQYAVILRGKLGNEAKLMKWGLVPSWVREISMWEGLPYAQAETLLEKRSFKQLVDSRRCVIPADGFYEWRNDWRKKTPMWFHLIGKNRSPLPVCGTHGEISNLATHLKRLP
jgi:putative SOS response-associated peptidase YedK